MVIKNNPRPGVRWRRGNNLVFKFSIGLHEDDTDVLRFIQKQLGIGSVTTRGKVSYFNVIKQEELLKIIEIFRDSHLNTTKHLNFLSFSEAYYLYTERRHKTIELKAKIDNIRSSMNNERLDFSMPEPSKHIRITPY